MDATSLEQLATALWPMVASGAMQRVGELGADEVVGQAEGLWHKITQLRRRRGDKGPPRSAEELQRDLAALLGSDPNAAKTIQVLVNHFAAEVHARRANFGIVNK